MRYLLIVFLLFKLHNTLHSKVQASPASKTQKTLVAEEDDDEEEGDEEVALLNNSGLKRLSY